MYAIFSRCHSHRSNQSDYLHLEACPTPSVPGPSHKAKRLAWKYGRGETWGFIVLWATLEEIGTTKDQHKLFISHHDFPQFVKWSCSMRTFFSRFPWNSSVDICLEIFRDLILEVNSLLKGGWRWNHWRHVKQVMGHECSWATRISALLRIHVVTLLLWPQLIWEMRRKAGKSNHAPLWEP